MYQDVHIVPTKYAIKYGLHSALILSCIDHETHINYANKINFHLGRYWINLSEDKLINVFPYLTISEIKNAIKNLLESHVIIQNQDDWYALNIKEDEIINDTVSDNNKDLTGYIYLVKDNDVIKIGKTRDCYLKRINTLKTANINIKIISVFYIDNYSALEKDLHNMYNDKRVGGEWFKLTQQDIIFIHNYLYINNGILQEIN